jgi:O-acetyl-ADP-ribose deacetylase (regulator of RNase III)
MKLILCAVDEMLAEAWQRFCGDLDFVEIHRGNILNVDCDAVVSPANSFGFMDGGLDLLYLRHFGIGLQDRVQRMIVERHYGELLVGTADVVETGDARIPYMVIAPTMRVPMMLTESVNPYLAARAVMLLVTRKMFESGPDAGKPIASKIERVAMSGLGTGVGHVSPNVCARQVRAAIDEVVLRQNSFPRTWLETSLRHQMLYTDMPKRLQAGPGSL